MNQAELFTRIDPSKLHGALDNAMKLGTMEVSVYVCCNHLPLLLLPTSPLYPSTQMNKFLPLCPLNFSSLFHPLSLHFSLSSNAPLSILHHFFPPSLPPPPFPLLFLSPFILFLPSLSPLPQQQEGVPSTMLPLVAQTSEEENKKPKTKELDVSLISAHFTIKLLYYNRIG